MTSENRISRNRFFWRWTLIVAELLVTTFTVFVMTIGRRENSLTHSMPVQVIGLFSGIAVLFLLFGGPFLVRSQGGLAILGWIVAATAILVPIL